MLLDMKKCGTGRPAGLSKDKGGAGRWDRG
jgi:hypothetical protein